MKVRLIFFVFFLSVVAALVITGKVMSSPGAAAANPRAKSVRTAESEPPSGISPSSSACRTGEFSFLPFKRENPYGLTAEAPPAGNNSQLIPDKVAYLMVFRLLSSHKNDAEKKQLRGYIRQILGIGDDGDAEAVFQLANDFKRRVKPFDNQINSIKDRYHPAHPPLSIADEQRMKRLLRDKEKAVDDLVADIPRRLSAAGKDRLNQSIQERVKAKIKMQ